MKKFSDMIVSSANSQQKEPENVLKGKFKIMKSDLLLVGRAFQCVLMESLLRIGKKIL